MIKRYIINISYVCLLTVVIIACRKDFEGDRNPTPPPTTVAIIDSVRRESADFLTTTVTGYWYGVSQHGFITGYEVSIDNMQTWSFTEEQRGTFTLNLPFGVREDFLPIYIRSIDNLGQKDPTPAQMVFPVRNSSPRVSLDPIAYRRPFSTFPIMRVVWNVADVDGINDIGSYELCFNDTIARPFSLNADFGIERLSDSTGIIAIRLEAVRTGITFTNNFNVFTGTRTTPVPGSLTGINYNEINKLFIRAVDRTGNISAWAMDSFFVRLPVSDILVVNALRSQAAATMNFYRTNFNHPDVNITLYDTLYGISTSTRQDEFYTDALTQSRTFNLFKKIVWLTDDPATLATCQQTTVDFFNNSGRMFISCLFDQEFPNTAPYLSFTPIEFIISDSLDGRFRLINGATASGIESNWPTIRSETLFAGVVRPIVTYNTGTGIFKYEELMRAQLQVQRSVGTFDWTGTSTVMSKRVRVINNKADIVISTLPLRIMNADNNMPDLFKKLFKDELGF
jgi:hypothetical protein